MKKIILTHNKQRGQSTLLILLLLLLLGVHAGCKKLVEINPPATSTNAENVYTNDATAAAVLTGIYASLSQQSTLYQMGTGFTSASLYLGLSSDELTLYDRNNFTFLSYYRNSLTSLPSIGTADYWGSIYPIIFIANSAIEQLNKSTTLTASVKDQLLGEARFIRAYCYFYLTNLYGDIPLVLGTNYVVNAALPRASKEQAYQQIIADLKEAQQMLNSDYLNSDVQTKTVERVRPTSWAATALLARAYLYTSDWVNAEAQASLVINHNTLYNLTTLNNTFLKNSEEAIWQLFPVGSGTNANTGEGKFFILPPTGPNALDHPIYLSNEIVKSFERGDQRKANWTESVVVGANIFYYPFKYKVGAVNDGSVKEYSMVLRLGEQYLIRAEARAQQDKLSEAAADLNVIRKRAVLGNTTAKTKTDLLGAIMQERKVELFTEWGHRWLDIKRTNSINAVMNEVTPKKGGIWQTTDQLYPIPLTDLQKAPQLIQNPGY